MDLHGVLQYNKTASGQGALTMWKTEEMGKRK